MDIDLNYDDELSSHAVREPEDEAAELSELGESILQAMQEYAVKHHVDLEGTVSRVYSEHGSHIVAVTLPKHISLDHRDMLEVIAYRKAAENGLKPTVQFIYEQPAQ